MLYCFFWGIAAVVWIKGIYPKAAWLIDILLKKTGWALTGILLVFMAFNILVSVLALVRYDTRAVLLSRNLSWILLRGTYICCFYFLVS